MDIHRNRLEKKKILSGSSISKLIFASWRRPIRGVDWKLWFEKLSDLHQSTWKKIGIYEAIKNTTYNTKRDDTLVLEMVSRWNSQTNTFVFGWGEAMITLEDILILGGFPVLGISPLSSIENDLEAMLMKNQLEEARLQIQRTKLRNAYQCDWMERFRDSEDSELEHAAFIAVWLSRHVFPSVARHSNIMNKKAFSLAILLSKGIKIALGQAILAMLYRDLTLLSEMLCSTQHDQPPKVCSVGGLFHIVQVWAWERFRLLKPIPSFIIPDPNLSRLAKWSNVAHIVDHRNLKAFMNDYERGFVWCPYGDFASNERSDLLSFAHWIKDSQLIGFDSCIEKYYPQRVVKQFGLEKDHPSDIIEDVKFKIQPSSSPSSETDTKPKLLNKVADFPLSFSRGVFEIIDIADSDSDDDDYNIKKVISSKIPGSGIGSKRPFSSSTEPLKACLMNKVESSGKGKNVMIHCGTFKELFSQAAPSEKGTTAGIQRQDSTPSHMHKAGSSLGKTVGILRGSIENVLQRNATPYVLNKAGTSSQSWKNTTIQRGTFEKVVLQASPGFTNKAGVSKSCKTAVMQHGSVGNVLPSNDFALINKATLHMNESSQNPSIRPVRRITMMEHNAYPHITGLESRRSFPSSNESPYKAMNLVKTQHTPSLTGTQIKRDGINKEAREGEGKVVDTKHDATKEMKGINTKSQVSPTEHGLSSAAESYTNKRSKNSFFDLEKRITRLENIVYTHVRQLEAVTGQLGNSHGAIISTIKADSRDGNNKNQPGTSAFHGNS